MYRPKENPRTRWGPVRGKPEEILQPKEQTNRGLNQPKERFHGSTSYFDAHNRNN